MWSIMLVIILNSGIGKRLFPLTEEIPKCMVKIGQKTILERELDILKKLGLNKLLITTGPFEEKIKELISSNYSDLEVKYVHNPVYDKTNYIYSIWLAKEIIEKETEEEILLLHGDLLFEKEVMTKLLSCSHENSVIINSKAPLPEKDFKARVENDLVKEIGVNVWTNALFCIPIYRMKRDFFKKWLDEMDKMIEKGEKQCYAENALNVLLDDLHLHSCYIDKEKCMEIDTFEDIKIAEKDF